MDMIVVPKFKFPNLKQPSIYLTNTCIYLVIFIRVLIA